MYSRSMNHRLLIFIGTPLILMGILLGSVSSIGYAATEALRVPANVEWLSTGLFVEQGQTISLVTQGKAITAPLNIFPGAISGPEGQLAGLGCGQYVGAPPPCALDDAPYGALIGRIGLDGEPFLIGAASSFTAPATGELYLVVNDNLGTYGDNRSGFTVVFRN